MELGARLKQVASLVSDHSNIADIGTDHAYLPVYLVERAIAQKAIASDNKQGPCEAAEKTVAAHGLSEKIDIRLGEGMETIKPGEVDTVIIAGMGGLTMRSILEAGKGLLAQGQIRTIVLQPQTDGDALRHWAEDNHWAIVQEELAKEGGKLYEMFRLEPCENYVYPGISYEIGSLLVSRKHPLLKEKLEKLIGAYETSLAGMDGSTEGSKNPRYGDIQERLKKLKEIYHENYSC